MPREEDGPYSKKTYADAGDPVSAYGRARCDGVESRTFAFYVRDEIHLLRAEFEVEQLRVLDDSRRRDGLRQRQDAPL